MKKAFLFTVLILVTGLILLNYSTFAHGGYMQHRNHFWGNGRGMGCGMRGMMNPGMMMGQGCWNWMQNHQGSQSGNQSFWKDLRFNSDGKLVEPLTKEQAKIVAQSYVEWMGNPRLKLGQIIDKEGVFEFTLVTKDDSLVEKYAIDKATAGIQPLDD